MTGNLPNPKAFSKWQGRQSIHEVTCIVNYKLVTVNYKLNISTGVEKHIYYSRISTKLMDSNSSQKAYGRILKSFLNNNNIPCNLPNQHSAF